MTTVRRLPTREAVTAAAAATIRDLLRASRMQQSAWPPGGRRNRFSLR